MYSCVDDVSPWLAVLVTVLVSVDVVCVDCRPCCSDSGLYLCRLMLLA